MLRTTTQQHFNDWPARLPLLLSAYRMTVHFVTGITPNFAMLGREVLCPCTLIAAPPQDATMSTTYNNNFRETLRDARQNVRDSLGARARTEKRYLDKRVKPVKLYLKQSVWLYWPRLLIRQARRKLVNLWSGPWTISRFCSPIVVQVQHTITHRRQIVYVDRLTPCEVQSQPEPQTVEQRWLVKHQVSEDDSEDNGLLKSSPTPSVCIVAPCNYKVKTSCPEAGTFPLMYWRIHQ